MLDPPVTSIPTVLPVADVVLPPLAFRPAIRLLLMLIVPPVFTDDMIPVSIWLSAPVKLLINPVVVIEPMVLFVMFLVLALLAR